MRRQERETGTPVGVPVSGRDLAGLRYVASLLAFRAIDDLELDHLTLPVIRIVLFFLAKPRRMTPHETHPRHVVATAVDTKKDRECAASTYDSWPPSHRP